jgi:hypothetical protein
MKVLLLTILLFASSLVIGQDTVGLRKEIGDLNEALLKKDAAVLNGLLDKQLIYGHSNGWLQTKEDLVTDFANGKIEYKKIEPSEFNYTITKQAIAVRSITKIEGVVNGNAFSMNLQVLQIWKRIKRHWVLIARQAVKLS